MADPPPMIPSAEERAVAIKDQHVLVLPDDLVDPIKQAYRDGFDAGDAAERARIVAWLRLEADLCNPEYRVILLALAREIERGDHAQPETARQTCGECDYDPDHLYHDCSDNPGTKPEPA